MKATEFFKVSVLALATSAIAIGCQQTDSTMTTTETAVEEECEGATPEVRNAIYAAKLKNARARNLGADWEETAELIEAAEAAAADCQQVRAKILANKAEQRAADAIAALQTESGESTSMAADSGSSTSSDSGQSPYLGGYQVVAGDNLWNIAGKDSIYGNPYQWPLIYKANSNQIKDADLIYPGQYFYIPNASGAEIDAAVQHAKSRGAWTIGETEASDMDYLNQ